MCESCGCGNHQHDHTHVVLPVSGMSCGHCVKQIEDGLSGLRGVDEVHADLEAGTVSFVLHDGGDLATIKEAVLDMGFEIH